MHLEHIQQFRAAGGIMRTRGIHSLGPQPGSRSLQATVLTRKRPGFERQVVQVLT